MNEPESALDALSERFEALNAGVTRTSGLTEQFSETLGGLQRQMVYSDKEVKSLSSSFGRHIRSAFDDVIFDGRKLSDALRGLGQSMLSTAYSTAMRPVQNALGGLMAHGVNALTSGIFPFAKGGAFVSGQVMPFAKGGVVSSPRTFPMRGGTGLMGEAGPEAIMPLTRGADGRLGVQAQGGGRSVQVTMNISTPDLASFRRSKSQVAGEMSRLISLSNRNR